MKRLKLEGFAGKGGNWMPAAIGCIALWILMGVFGSGKISIGSLVDNAYTASFLAIAGLAQMLVVTTGRGAIDLSIPGMITLGAYVSMGIANGQNRMIIPALLAVAVCGIVAGFFNSMMVTRLKIPAIIATMAMNYIIVTATMLIGKNFNVFTVPAILKNIATFRIAGLPIMIAIVILIALLINFLLKSTAYGKSLMSMGQNLEAARLAGVNVFKTEMLTYIFSAVMSGLSGALISARVTGAYLGMGDSYQMDSIACIVVGGTLMSGGRAHAGGTLVGSLFLYLIISCMQLLEANAGIQSLVKGTLIIGVLLIGPGKRGAPGM